MSDRVERGKWDNQAVADIAALLSQQKQEMIERLKKEKEFCDEFHCKVFDDIINEIERKNASSMHNLR